MFEFTKDTEPSSQEKLCKCGDEGEVHHFDERGFLAALKVEQAS
jgi:hypothetical protein